MARSKAKRTAIKALDALYATLPTIECRGLCQSSCVLTADLVSVLEHIRISVNLGVAVEFPTEARTGGIGNDLDGNCTACPLLLKSGSCSVYSIRPLMCRLWGIVADERMVCPWGCAPARYLSDGEAQQVWAKSQQIVERYLRESGHESQIENHDEVDNEQPE